MLEELKKEFEKYIRGIYIKEPQDAVFSEFRFYNSEINNLLKTLNIKLYKHQKEALENLYKKKNVVVTTPTASGKSEIFRLFIFDYFLQNKLNTFLLIFPTRALLYDQLEKLEERIRIYYKITNKKPSVKILLGDLSKKEKQSILKDYPNILLTTIDNLHLFLLKNHHRIPMFFKNLKLIVIDEAHIYRGVFGTNAAYVFRRLFRLLDFFYANKNYRILALSATLRNATKFLNKLTSKEFIEISKDYSKRSTRYYIALESKHSPKLLLRKIIRFLLEKNVKSLVFIESKKGVELSRISLMELDKNNKISSYKASLTRNKRKEIESKFKQGDVLILITTSALELGIDIGDVSAVVNYGIPKDGLFSLIQRFGRAGRRREGYNIVIFRDDALDFYYSLNINEFFDKLVNTKIEELPINLENEEIVRKHLLYLINEFGRLDPAILTDFEKKILHQIEKERKIKKVKDYFFNKEYYTLSENIIYAGLRNISDKIFVLLKYNDSVVRYIRKIKDKEAYKALYVLKSKNLVIEELDEYAFYEYLLPGMVYYSQGKALRSVEFIKKGNIYFVFAREDNINIETLPISIEDVEILETKNCKKFKDWQICHGKIKVKKHYLGYIEKIKNYNQQRINYYDDPITREFITSSLWIIIPNYYRDVDKIHREYFLKKLKIYLKRKNYKLPIEYLMNIVTSIDKEFLYEKYRGYTSKKIIEIIDNYLKKLGIEDNKLVFLLKKLVDSEYAFRSGLHAIEHNIIKISPIITNIDSRELGGYSYPIHPQTESPTIFIYEGYENGIGLAKILYNSIEDLINKSRKILFSCKCLDGCPRCVFSTKCGNFNEFLDKYAARFIYKKFFYS